MLGFSLNFGVRLGLVQLRLGETLRLGRVSRIGRLFEFSLRVQFTRVSRFSFKLDFRFFRRRNKNLAQVLGRLQWNEGRRRARCWGRFAP